MTKYVAMHDCWTHHESADRRGQILGAAVMGASALALHRGPVYDAKSGQPLTAGFYYDRIPTHLDAARRSDLRPERRWLRRAHGAKSIGNQASSCRLRHQQRDLQRDWSSFTGPAAIGTRFWERWHEDLC